MKAFTILMVLFGLAYLGSPDGRALLSELSSASAAQDDEQENERLTRDVRQAISDNEPAWAKRCERELRVYCPWAHSIGDRKTCLKLNLRDLPESCSSAVISE